MSDLHDRATALYESRWRAQLESTHRHWFLAIEPDSAEYFLSPTFDGAIDASRKAHPDKLSFIIRIGHKGAVEIGGRSE